MTPLRIVHAPDAEALLRHAAAPLVAARPGASLPLLAVRQGGIRDDVLALADEAGCPGWLGEPLVVFRELLALIAGDVAPLSTFERDALLRRVLRSGGPEGLRELRDVRGFLVAVDELIGSLHAERVTPERLAEALRAAGPAGRWEEARDRELVRVYAAWREALAALPPRHGRPRRDGRDLAALAAEAVRADPAAVARRVRRPFAPPGERRPLDLYGLADLSGGWRALLDALLEDEVFSEVRVHLLAAPPAQDATEALAEGSVLAELGPRAAEVLALDGSPRPAALARVRDELFVAPAAAASSAAAEPGLPPASPLSFAAAPDTGRELARVARRVKRLLVERGAEPRSIAIVVRGLRPEGPRAVQELHRHGVPVTARLRYRLSEVPAVAALLRVFRLAAEGWSRRALIELAESPYFDLWLDPGVLGFVASRARPSSLAEWAAELERALAMATAAEDDAEREYRGPSAARIQEALTRFRAFAGQAGRFEAARPRSAWTLLALEVLGAGVLPGEVRPGLWDFAWRAGRPPAAADADPDPLRVEAARLDARALAAARDALAAWRDALPLDPDGDPDLAPREWLEEVGAAFADGELAAWTPHRHGVQVIEALAAVGRSFEHVFVVGLGAADFPSRPPRRPLLGEPEVERLRAAGLPLEGAGEWLAREASLYRAVVSAARRTLDLGFTYADATGAAVLPSQYLEETAALFHPADPDALLERIPGSRLLPEEAGELWAPEDALLFGAAAWRRSRGDAASALAPLAEAARVAPASAARALHGAAIEHLRALHRQRTGRLSVLHPYNGEVSDPDLLASLAGRFRDAVWSASRLETYGFCPFRFFGTQVLRLAPLREAEEDMDALTRGTVVHAALERLHRALVDRHGARALKSEQLEEAAELLAEIVPAVIDEEAARGWLGAAELRGPAEEGLRRSLLRYVRWEMEQNDEGYRDRPPRMPVAFEWRFGDGINRPEAELWQGERVLRLRGRIDRIDEVSEGPGRGRRYVVDHKSGPAAFEQLTAKREAGALLQLELYLHALDAHGDVGEGLWGGAYQIVNVPGRKAPLHLYSIAQGRIKDDNKTQKEARERLDAALTRALDHVDDIVGGRFPASIPGGCECPAYCELREVCREDRLARRDP